MTRTRAFRRHQEAKMKARCRHLFKTTWGVDFEPNDRQVGYFASTHFKPCSCYMCMNRRGSEGKTRQELMHELSMLEQITDEI